MHTYVTSEWKSDAHWFDTVLKISTCNCKLIKRLRLAQKNNWKTNWKPLKSQIDIWYRFLMKFWIVNIKVWIWGTRRDRYPSQAESNGCQTRPQRKVRMQLKRDKEASLGEENLLSLNLLSWVGSPVGPIQFPLGSLTFLPLDILPFCCLLTFAWSSFLGPFRLESHSWMSACFHAQLKCHILMIRYTHSKLVRICRIVTQFWTCRCWKLFKWQSPGHYVALQLKKEKMMHFEKFSFHHTHLLELLLWRCEIWLRENKKRVCLTDCGAS